MGQGVCGGVKVFNETTPPQNSSQQSGSVPYDQPPLEGHDGVTPDASISKEVEKGQCTSGDDKVSSETTPFQSSSQQSGSDSGDQTSPQGRDDVIPEPSISQEEEKGQHISGNNTASSGTTPPQSSSQQPGSVPYDHSTPEGHDDVLPEPSISQEEGKGQHISGDNTVSSETTPFQSSSQQSGLDLEDQPPPQSCDDVIPDPSVSKEVEKGQCTSGDNTASSETTPPQRPSQQSESNSGDQTSPQVCDDVIPEPSISQEVEKGQHISGNNTASSEATPPQSPSRQSGSVFTEYPLKMRVPSTPNNARSFSGSNRTTNKTKQTKTSHQPSRPVPFIQPPRRRRDALIRDPSIFQKVDQHALNAPSSARSSVKTLARFLVQPATSDLEKVRAFFRWITHNISYAHEELKSNHRSSRDAEFVLRSGRTVCEGYAKLFLALCDHAQIPCLMVIGFSKGPDDDPEDPFTPLTRDLHAWNLVYVKGEWRPVDCTWGSCFVENNKALKEYHEIYFLTDPEDFIIHHFPFMDNDLRGSIKFQLLRKPWSLNTFNHRVQITYIGLECGLRTLTHNGWNIPVSKEVVVKVRTDRVKVGTLRVILRHNNTEVQGSVLVRKGKDSSFSVTVRPPSPGKYELAIDGETTKKGYVKHFVTYVINCTEAMGDFHPYPKDRRTQYGPTACAEEHGLGADDRALDVLVSKDGTLDVKLSLKRKMPALFSLTYAEGDIPDLDHHVMATYGDKFMQVHVRLPRAGFYKLTVFGKHPAQETNLYREVLNLLLECLKDNGDCEPFPKSFGAASELSCTLVEPLSRCLPAHQQVKVQLTSSLLKRMRPDSLEQDGDTWRGLVQTEGPGSKLKLWGSKDRRDSWNALFEFLVK